jgi:hypothetical protein
VIILLSRSWKLVFTLVSIIGARLVWTLTRPTLRNTRRPTPDFSAPPSRAEIDICIVVERDPAPLKLTSSNSSHLKPMLYIFFLLII